MAPYSLVETFGQVGFFGIVFLLGIGFGVSLEQSGFGDSRKLAAQFYLKDLTVLKVMFTAIIVAMVLIFLTSAIGLLDYDQVWVNPTFMLPGIVGGLIMGVGFVIGGFCPGTSLVALASLKLDGLFFVTGVLFGIFIFGDTIDSTFAHFWISTDMGRYTVQDWLGLDAGTVVFFVVIIAIALFFIAEKVEEKIGGQSGVLRQNRQFKVSAAAILTVIALLVMIIGQPTIEEQWQRLPVATQQKLADKAVFIEPIEMLSVMKGRFIRPVLLDIRPESRFNLFHLVDAHRYTMADLVDPKRIRGYKTATDRVYFIIADDETSAAEAWKTLVAQKVPNVYILNNGLDGWITYFSQHPNQPHHDTIDIGYMFEKAVGSDHPLADPDFSHYNTVKFEPKVKLTVVKAAAGGCG